MMPTLETLFKAHGRGWSQLRVLPPPPEDPHPVPTTCGSRSRGSHALSAPADTHTNEIVKQQRTQNAMLMATS